MRKSDLRRCPYCGSVNTVRNGYKNGKQERKCRDCRLYFYTVIQEELPLVLLLDIETSPLRVFTWGIHKQWLTHTNIISDWFVISWSAKWLFKNGTMSDVLTPDEAVKGDDERIIKTIWSLMDDADIVIAHNGDRFDIKRLNTRFIMHGMQPPAPYQTIDTLKVLRRDKTGFSFASNRLDFIGQLVRNKGKLETGGFDLWKRCLNGEADALAYMEKYNREDVALLEEVYLWLRPWIKGHPNIGLYMNTTDPVCTHCGSDNISWEDAYYTPAGKFSVFRCNGCGALGRCKTTALSKQKRDKLTRSLAR